jgi:hypothetical protein
MIIQNLNQLSSLQVRNAYRKLQEKESDLFYEIKQGVILHYSFAELQELQNEIHLLRLEKSRVEIRLKLLSNEARENHLL